MSAPAEVIDRLERLAAAIRLDAVDDAAEVLEDLARDLRREAWIRDLEGAGDG